MHVPEAGHLLRGEIGVKGRLKFHQPANEVGFFPPQSFPRDYDDRPAQKSGSKNINGYGLDI